MVISLLFASLHLPHQERLRAKTKTPYSSQEFALDYPRMSRELSLSDFVDDLCCADPIDISLLARIAKRGVSKVKDESKVQQEAEKRANSQLSRRCQRVELDPEKLDHQQYYSCYLGKFKDVSARTSCPLCRLAVAAITEI